MSSEQISNLTALVEETMRTLYEKGAAAIDLAPLVKLHDAVKALDIVLNPGAAPPPAAAPSGEVPGAPGYSGPDARRDNTDASQELLARASAIIDVLVQGGQTPEHASQVITRQLLAVRIQLPVAGGDVRAWKRLLYWRNNLIHHRREGPAWDVYCRFKEELTHIPPENRLRVAVGERLWDQRQQEIAARNIA